MEKGIDLETLTAKQHYIYNINDCSKLLPKEKEQGCCLMLDEKLTSKLLTKTRLDENIIYGLDTKLLFKSIINHPKYDYIINLVISIYDRFGLSNKKEINELVKYQQLSNKLNRPLNDNELLEQFNIQLDNPKLNNKEVLSEIRSFIYFIYAYHTLLNANLRLVINIAGKYTYDNQIDLIGEGNIALMRAIDRFNYKKGNRFSTYANYYIWQAIHDEYYRNRSQVSIPPNNNYLVKNFIKDVKELEKKENRKLSREEIADKLGLSLSTVNTYYSSMVYEVHLDKPVGDRENNTGFDFVASTSRDILDNVFLETDIEILFKELNEREREIFRLYNGIGTDFEYSQEDLAELFGVTKQRIGQILSKATEKVYDMPKYNVKAHYLKEYL